MMSPVLIGLLVWLGMMLAVFTYIEVRFWLEERRER